MKITISIIVVLSMIILPALIISLDPANTIYTVGENVEQSFEDYLDIYDVVNFANDELIQVEGGSIDDIAVNDLTYRDIFETSVIQHVSINSSYLLDSYPVPVTVNYPAPGGSINVYRSYSINSSLNQELYVVLDISNITKINTPNSYYEYRNYLGNWVTLSTNIQNNSSLFVTHKLDFYGKVPMSNIQQVVLLKPTDSYGFVLNNFFSVPMRTLGIESLSVAEMDALYTSYKVFKTNDVLRSYTLNDIFQNDVLVNNTFDDDSWWSWTNAQVVNGRAQILSSSGEFSGIGKGSVFVRSDVYYQVYDIEVVSGTVSFYEALPVTYGVRDLQRQSNKYVPYYDYITFKRATATEAYIDNFYVYNLTSLGLSNLSISELDTYYDIYQSQIGVYTDDYLYRSRLFFKDWNLQQEDLSLDMLAETREIMFDYDINGDDPLEDDNVYTPLEIGYAMVMDGLLGLIPRNVDDKLVFPLFKNIVSLAVLGGEYVFDPLFDWFNNNVIEPVFGWLTDAWKDVQSFFEDVADAFDFSWVPGLFPQLFKPIQVAPYNIYYHSEDNGFVELIESNTRVARYYIQDDLFREEYIEFVYPDIIDGQASSFGQYVHVINVYGRNSRTFLSQTVLNSYSITYDWDPYEYDPNTD
jgi:hypothetical protein